MTLSITFSVLSSLQKTLENGATEGRPNPNEIPQILIEILVPKMFEECNRKHVERALLSNLALRNPWK